LETIGGADQGNLAGNSYLKSYGNIAFSATAGALIPYDITIVGLSWAQNAGVAGTLEVRRSGVLIDGTATGGAATGSDLTINSDFAANGIFSIYWNSANQCNNMYVRVWYRRHAT
jgi:hypothetical protein